MYGVVNGVDDNQANRVAENVIWISLITREEQAETMLNECIDIMTSFIDPHNAHGQVQHIDYWSKQLREVRWLLSNFRNELTKLGEEHVQSTTG